MATKYFTAGAGTGNWSTAGNWSDGSIPATGDTVYIKNTVAYALTNVDRTGDGAGAGLNLVQLVFEPGYNYAIGDVSNPMKLTADAIYHFGGGPLYFTSATGSGAQITDKILIDCAGSVFLDGTANTTIVDVIRCPNLQVNCVSGGLISKLAILYRDRPADDVIATLTRLGTSGSPIAVINAGTVTRDTGGPNADNDTFYMSGGTVTTNVGAGTWRMSGGYLDWRDYAVGGVIGAGNLFCYRGVVDTANVAKPKFGTLEYWKPTAIVNEAPGIVYTTRIVHGE